MSKTEEEENIRMCNYLRRAIKENELLKVSIFIVLIIKILLILGLIYILIIYNKLLLIPFVPICIYIVFTGIINTQNKYFEINQDTENLISLLLKRVDKLLEHTE